MEIKLNIIFSEILVTITDEHEIEKHDKFFVDKQQKSFCVECINKLLFTKCPLYKKYLLFKNINDIYRIKNCHEFRYHFSFFLLDHTLFLSNTFRYLEEECKINENKNENNKDDYIYSVNNELITLATNACKEFLNICSEELCNIFKDAIYTCVLIRLKNYSMTKRKYFFILKLLKNLIQHVQIIHTTLKEESSVIGELMKLFIKNYSISNNINGAQDNTNRLLCNKINFDIQDGLESNTNNNTAIKLSSNLNSNCDNNIDTNRNNSYGNDKYHNMEHSLILQIIYELWCENSLWQLNKDLLKSFFINLIKNFKFTNKNTDLCNYYIDFIYLICNNYNDITYFFTEIIFDTKHLKKNKNNTIANICTSPDTNYDNGLDISISHKRSNLFNIDKGNTSDQSSIHSFSFLNAISDENGQTKNNKKVQKGEKIMQEKSKEDNENNYDVQNFSTHNEESDCGGNTEMENCTDDHEENKFVFLHSKDSENRYDKKDVYQLYSNKCNDIVDYPFSEENDLGYYSQDEDIKEKETNFLKSNNENTHDASSNCSINKLNENYLIINKSLSYNSSGSNTNKNCDETKMSQYKKNKCDDNIYHHFNELHSINHSRNSSQSFLECHEEKKQQRNGSSLFQPYGVEKKQHEQKVDITKIINNEVLTNKNDLEIRKMFDSSEYNTEQINCITGDTFHTTIFRNNNSNQGEKKHSKIKSFDGNKPNFLKTENSSTNFVEYGSDVESGICFNSNLLNKHKKKNTYKDKSHIDNRRDINSFENYKFENTKIGGNKKQYNGSKDNKLNLSILEKTDGIQIFIILCDNLQETLLNNFNRDIQMKCLEIFSNFCSVDETVVNIIISNTSLVEWIFDFLSNTKHECLREKGLKFLVTFFFRNTLFSKTHAHYMLDVLINIILKYVNKNDDNYNTAYDSFSNNYSTFFFFLKTLNMLIDIANSSIKIFHIFKIINIISFLVDVPDFSSTNIENIILLFEKYTLKNESIKGDSKNHFKLYDSCDPNSEEDKNGENKKSISNSFRIGEKNIFNLDSKQKTMHNNRQDQNIPGKKYFGNLSTKINKKSSLFLHRDQTCDNIEATNCKQDKNIKKEKEWNEIGNNEKDSDNNIELDNIINKIYIAHILALFEVVKTALNIIKIVNMNNPDIYIEFLDDRENKYLSELYLAIIKLLFSLIYILNKNETFLININVMDEKSKKTINIDNENEFQILTFIKLVLYFFTELHSLFRNIMKEKNNPFGNDILIFIKFLYLSSIFIFDNINQRKIFFNNISTNILFSSFFTPFFYFFSRILSHIHDIYEDFSIENRETQKINNLLPNNSSTLVEDDQYMTNNVQKQSYDKIQDVINTFSLYKKRMRKVLVKNAPFTIFFQYASTNCDDCECYRILEMLIYEDDKVKEEEKNKKDILMEIIKNNDFYFTNVLLFNFNDNERLIETVIYIFYLCLSYDKKFIEKKLNNSKVNNYVENMFTSNEYSIDMNPFYLFMSLSYSYYFVTKEKILTVFRCIKKEMHKINILMWLEIKQIKNIYFVFDCIFSLKVNVNNYNLYVAFIIYIIKLELSLYSSQQSDQIDNRLYMSISKNKVSLENKVKSLDLVKKLLEDAEMENIQNNDIIYIYYLIIKLKKYSSEYCKNINIYKMMNTVIRYMNTISNKSEEINDIFSFFFIFFENLEVYTQKDIFNIIIVLQKLSFYVKNSLNLFFKKAAPSNSDHKNMNDDDNKISTCKSNICTNSIEDNDETFILSSLKFENSFFYFILNLILYCRKYNQIKNINILSSSVPIIQLLIHAIQFTNNYFKSLAIFVLALLILPFPKIQKTNPPLLMILSTSFDKSFDDILLSSNKYEAPHETIAKEKYIIRKCLFLPLVNSVDINIRVSALSLLLSLLITSDTVLLNDEAFSFFIFLINSSFLNEWNDIQNELIFAIINVLLLSTILNLRTKSFCFNFIHSFRPFFLRSILPLNRNEKIVIHKLFFILTAVKIKPLWFDLKGYSEKILKIILNVVTKKDLDLMTFNCISSLAYEAFLMNKNNMNRNNNNKDTNKNVIENLEKYLETYKKNVKNNDEDVYQSSIFNKFKCEHIDYDVVLAILNATRLLLYK
ncbi:conserved Plasmodium protein, unknown function [Plasmodium chabaudi chabaudi]|uniref:Uncharacterized protein n=1 Tax=Plasmodium chabaudi chabaudi TaxID=31271 RepID=A0A1D3LFG9_PLACU|nr:conserved Plasmodium protein, unknown function [Plasmodium chabaudi chabaudi]